MLRRFAPDTLVPHALFSTSGRGSIRPLWYSRSRSRSLSVTNRRASAGGSRNTTCRRTGTGRAEVGTGSSGRLVLTGLPNCTTERGRGLTSPPLPTTTSPPPPNLQHTLPENRREGVKRRLRNNPPCPGVSGPTLEGSRRFPSPPFYLPALHDRNFWYF